MNQFDFRWDRVDFKNKLIHVSRSRDRYGLRESTKTNSSFRFIPMNDACFEAMVSLKNQNRHNEIVFVHQVGDIIDVQHVSERPFRKIIEEAGIKRIRFHDLRATFAANICMAPNGDLYALSKILGHSNVDMTVKKYAHLHNDFLKKVSNAVSFK